MAEDTTPETAAGEEFAAYADEARDWANLTLPLATETMPADLRARLAEVATRWMLMYPFANWGFVGCADDDAMGSLSDIVDSIAATWGGDIADRMLGVLLEDPGDLPARMATEMRRHDIEESTHAGYRCSCGQTVTDWDEHLAAAAMSVRWAHSAWLAAENDYLRRRAEHAEGELSSRKYHNTRWEAAEAQVAAIRQAVIGTYGEDYDDEDVPAAVERLMRHLSEYEADVRRISQSKSEALESAQAQVAALQRELAEKGAKLDRVIQGRTKAWLDRNAERKRANEAERELTEAKQAVYTARLTHIREWHPNYALMGACSGCQALAPLSAAMPSRPDDPEEIRRLAQATTERTED